MKTSTRAATAAGFALTLMLSVNCNHANAQKVGTAASNYKAPTSATASMADTPSAPTLAGTGCGSIGPQGADVVVVPLSSETTDAKAVAVSGNNLIAENFDGGKLLRSFSDDLDQFKGKVAEKAFSFLGSLQTIGRKESSPVTPTGYTVTRQPLSVSPMVP